MSTGLRAIWLAKADTTVIVCLTRYLVVRLRTRCAGVRVRQWRLDTVCWFMLGCVAFSVYCHTGRAHKCKMRLTCVLNTALDLTAAALCIGWRVEGRQVGLI